MFSLKQRKTRFCKICKIHPIGHFICMIYQKKKADIKNWEKVGSFTITLKCKGKGRLIFSPSWFVWIWESVSPVFIVCSLTFVPPPRVNSPSIFKEMGVISTYFNHREHKLYEYFFQYFNQQSNLHRSITVENFKYKVGTNAWFQTPKQMTFLTKPKSTELSIKEIQVYRKIHNTHYQSHKNQQNLNKKGEKKITRKEVK